MLIIRSHSTVSRITATVFGVDENIRLPGTNLMHVRMTVQNIDNEVIHQCPKDFMLSYHIEHYENCPFISGA